MEGELPNGGSIMGKVKPKPLKNPTCEVVIDNNLTWIDATPDTAKFMWQEYAMEKDLNLT